jgi:predicted aspartyl protease
VEINNNNVEGLIDTRASMSVLAAIVVRELGIMHLVVGSEYYKTASSVITWVLGRIEGLLVWIRETNWSMTFMVVDMDNYDVLLGLDFLIKISAIVDIECGLILIKQGPRLNVQVQEVLGFTQSWIHHPLIVIGNKKKCWFSST